jgi:hypothetical protein
MLIKVREEAAASISMGGPNGRKTEITLYHYPEDHNVKFHESLEFRTDDRLIFPVLASRLFVAEVPKAICKKNDFFVPLRKRTKQQKGKVIHFLVARNHK